MADDPKAPGTPAPPAPAARPASGAAGAEHPPKVAAPSGPPDPPPPAGLTPPSFIASLQAAVPGSVTQVAYWVGDFVNSFVMAKMKIWSEGRHLWMRTIGSTICGQGIDSLLFYPIAFYSLLDNATLASLMVFNVLFKIGVEVAFTPATYWVVNALKRAEGVDTYDRDISFSPFSLKDEGETQTVK